MHSIPPTYISNPHAPALKHESVVAGPRQMLPQCVTTTDVTPACDLLQVAAHKMLGRRNRDIKETQRHRIVPGGQLSEY